MDTLEPQIVPETNREEKEERKGAGFFASLLNKLGLGGGAEGSAGIGAASSGAGGAGIASGLFATKAGIVALIVAGTTMAAGIGVVGRSVLSNRSGPSGNAWSLFPEKSGGAAAQQAGAPAGGASSSLDYLQQAAKADPTLQSNEQVASAEAPAAAGSASPEGSRVQAPDNSNAPANVSSARVSAPAGKLQKTPGFAGQGGGSSGGSMSSQAPAVGGLTSGQGRTGGLTAMNRSVSGVSAGNRRALVGSGGMRASDQAISARNVGQGVARSYAPSMQRAGTTFDGGAGLQSAPAGAPQAATGGGLETGPANRYAPSTVVDQKQVPQPKPADPPKDSNPYQWAMWTAIGALAVGLIALAILGGLKAKATALQLAIKVDIGLGAAGAAKLATDIAAYNALIGTGKMLAGLATAAGALATAMGVIMATRYQQTMIGMMFGAIGGLLTLQAGMRFMALLDVNPLDPKTLTGLTGDALDKALTSAITPFTSAIEAGFSI